MTDKRTPALDARKASALLRWYFGEHTGITLGFSVALLIFGGLFVNGLFQIILDGITFWQGVLTLAPFPLLGCYILRKARQDLSRVHIGVEERAHPGKARALILFLSPLKSWARDDTDMVRGLIEANKPPDHESFLSKDLRKRFQGPWRMPLDAIAHHYPALEYLVTIPSADRIDHRTGSSERGTHAIEADFHKLIACLTPASGHPITLHPIAKLDDRWRTGANFESIADLVGCIEAAYGYLNHQGLNDADILVDITGGQKPSTIAGAIVSLAEGRRFQYVSTHDLTIARYDVTYSV